MTDRRTRIAEAGIRILAARGARALTHLNVDRDLGLAEGSTSYYARTRRDLIVLVVDRLATRTGDDLAAHDVPGDLTPRTAARLVVAGLDDTMRRADDHRARLILLLECHADPELRASLATRPRMREKFARTATSMLRKLNVDDPDVHAQDLAGLVDALLMQRIVRAAPIDEEDIIAAYLTGLAARTP